VAYITSLTGCPIYGKQIFTALSYLLNSIKPAGFITSTALSTLVLINISDDSTAETAPLFNSRFQNEMEVCRINITVRYNGIPGQRGETGN